MNRYHLFIVLSFLYQTSMAQKNNSFADSLQNKSYEYLDDKVYELRRDSIKAVVYLSAYLYKAKREQNWKELVNGYQNMMHLSPEKSSLIYADSMVYAAKKSNENALLGSAYLSKGINYYSLKQWNAALDNYITAESYIAKTTDPYLLHKLRYHIALVKYYLGYYDESISLLKQCIAYFRMEHPRPYLNSLHSLGLSYNKNGNYGLCTETNQLGLQQCSKLDIPEMEIYFIHSEGINEYFKQNYASAIQNIESTIDKLREYKDFGNESVGYFYIGKSYWQVKKYEKAIPYFEKVDALFTAKGYIRPDQREVYELLINYYKTQDKPELQLYYIDQLLKADNILNETFKYLVGKINKEYNTKELLDEKDRLQEQLQNKNHSYMQLTIFTSVLFTGFLYLTYRHLKNRQLYKQRYEELMTKISATEDKNKTRFKTEKPEILDINSETVALLLKQLEKFETDQKFLDKDWTLDKLSALFNSNNKYLSKIIHHYRDKSFNDYINDLRIEYIITLLNTDKKARNYTNTALAAEAGFSSTQRFANAFKAKTGMPTAYFTGRIKKEQP